MNEFILMLLASRKMLSEKILFSRLTAGCLAIQARLLPTYHMAAAFLQTQQPGVEKALIQLLQSLKPEELQPPKLIRKNLVP